MTNYQIIARACDDALYNMETLRRGNAKYSAQREAYWFHFWHVVANCERLLARTGGRFNPADADAREAFRLMNDVVKMADTPCERVRV